MMRNPAHSPDSPFLIRRDPMAPSPVSRRSLLVAMITVCGQSVGCRHQPRRPLHTWVRDPYDACGVAAVPTIVLPTLGEGPWDLRREFQRALSAQLRKAKRMTIVEGDLSPVGTACACSPSSTTWDEQLEMLSNVPAMQAVVSKITYLQPTAPIKLGLVVELRDVATRETLRQVEGLWDAPRCHPTSLRKCMGKRVAEPPWSGDLHRISPRQLLEQAALEISRDLQGIELIGPMEVTCPGETGPTSTR
jgi:hypothetical protein